MDEMTWSHKGLLARLTLLWHFAIGVTLFLLSRLPSFDSSAALILNERWPVPLLRWDVFHFAHIAESGYVYEFEYAFLPGTPIIMRTGGKWLSSLLLPASNGPIAQLVAGSLVSAALAIDTTWTLYDLSILHLRSSYAALLVSLLSLFSASPATLRFAPYAEPFFTYASYKGMLYCARRQFFRASTMFALASLFRSNGIMLSGYIVWGVLSEEVLSGSHPFSDVHFMRLVLRVSWCFLLASLPVLPFLWHQYAGYVQFCGVSLDERPWCRKRFPLIYSFVQSKYWDVGPFRYWTIQQVPNILLALPVLVLLFYGSISHIRASVLPRLSFLRLRNDASLKQLMTTPEDVQDPFTSPSVTPHAIHAFVLSTILLTSAHTQIALRLASALPFTYWMAARLLLPAPCIDVVSKEDHDFQDEVKKEVSYRAARLWLGWSMIWGTISLVTWGVFLPPA